MTNGPVRKVLILGGGSAGFLVGLALRRKLPEIDVTIVRSPEIKIIGVGEGTSMQVPEFFHHFLEVDPAAFFEQVNPIWKLGVHYVWGTRPYFNYAFGTQLDAHESGFSKPVGYYCQDDIRYTDINSSLITERRVFERNPNGSPIIPYQVAYHLENTQLVEFLETFARSLGIAIEEETMCDTVQDDHGITSLTMKSGRSMTADLYVDCSGFRSALLSKTLGVPFRDFRSTLFCDGAILGTWQRDQGEPIQAYTTIETMEAGWSWRTDHEDRVNRGYVYSSDFITKDEAEAEFTAKNPGIKIMGQVGFSTGCYARSWEKNVLAIGNASGFVEPLEATSLGAICADCVAMVAALRINGGRITESLRNVYNRRASAQWEAVRYNLGAHFKYNRRIDTPFWKRCQEETDIGWAQALEDFYRENGPGRLFRKDWIPPPELFDFDGFLHMLVGQQVPYKTAWKMPEAERKLWKRRQSHFRDRAKKAMTVEEALEALRHPSWKWNQEFYRRWPV